MAVRLADKIKQSNDASFYLVDAADVETNAGVSLETRLAAIDAKSSLNIQVVDELPTQDISTTTIYLVPNDASEVDNIYDEYIYVNNAWELIGSTAIDLTDYYTKTEVDGMIPVADGTTIIDNDGVFSAAGGGFDPATDTTFKDSSRTNLN